jgi:hypothetical protein
MPSRAAPEPTQLGAGSQGGNTPLSPTSDARGGGGDHWWPATSPPRAIPPMGLATATNLPTRRLDQNPIGRPPGRSHPPPTCLGFSHFQFRHRKKEEGGSGGVWGRRRARRALRHHRAAPGRPEAVRGPKPGPPGREPSCRGGGSCACSRSWSRGSTTAGNVYITDVNDYT